MKFTLEPSEVEEAITAFLTGLGMNTQGVDIELVTDEKTGMTSADITVDGASLSEVLGKAPVKQEEAQPKKRRTRRSKNQANKEETTSGSAATEAKAPVTETEGETTSEGADTNEPVVTMTETATDTPPFETETPVVAAATQEAPPTTSLFG